MSDWLLASVEGLRERRACEAMARRVAEHLRAQGVPRRVRAYWRLRGAAMVQGLLDAPASVLFRLPECGAPALLEGDERDEFERRLAARGVRV